uniref:Uncharacterized protein n=1 Tax=Arundo donax TaxID=35708 RepID=A0A0A8ZBP0_ARUDO
MATSFTSMYTTLDQHYTTTVLNQQLSLGRQRALHQLAVGR